MQTDRTPGPLFSVICASNRRDVLERFLLPSVRAQDVPYELRVVDTTLERFTSCAAALNMGASGARGHYLLFVHQDVAWEEPDFLRRAAALLDGLPDLAIAGVIGMSDKGKTQAERGRNAVLLGDFPGVLHGWKPIETPEVVQTVDDQLLILPAHIFRRLSFDAETCVGWHLYAVDYCLSAAQLGLRTYVLPMRVHHLSSGTVDASYFRTLRKVVAKHRRLYPWIYTTCGAWTTRRPVLLQEISTYAHGAVRRAIRSILTRLGLWNLIRRGAPRGSA